MPKFPNLTNVIKKPYYYVPKCPCCGSMQTGRYIKEHRDIKDDKWIIKESFQNGEIVCIIPEIQEGANAFCLNCEYIWEAYIEYLWLSQTEINKERMMRGTDALFHELYTSDEDKEKEKKEGFLKRHVKKYFGV